MNKFKRDALMFKSITNARKKCKCGHTQLLGTRDRVICSWCKHWIYKDKQTEFKYNIINTKNVLNKYNNSSIII